jgi:hypothetical protein
MSDSIDRLRGLPVEGRKLLGVILRQASHGSLRTKEPGMATMPEVHEACGLDVDGMYAALGILRDAGMIQLAGDYPFEEIRLTGAREIALEDIAVPDG